MLGRVFVRQPSNQSDPLQTDISPTNPPSQLCKYCTVTVRAAHFASTHGPGSANTNGGNDNVLSAWGHGGVHTQTLSLSL